MQLLTVDEYRDLVDGTDTLRQFSHGSYDGKRRWSYGDVENNGVYYHPQLTHYAHQVFEEFFYEKTQLHYVDLSRTSTESEVARDRFTKARDLSEPLARMTFPVGVLHQLMFLPMRAGEEFGIWIDTVDVGSSRKKIGVRAWVYDSENSLAAVVIWLRWAKELDPVSTIEIPAWFPRRAA